MAGHNWDEVACRTWDILVECANRSTTIYYSDLGARLGIHERALRPALDKVQDYCLQNQLPPLNILAVSKGTDRPGEGFAAAPPDAIAQRQKDVLDHPWDANGNPFEFARDGTTEEELVELLLAAPSSAEAVYRKVKDRGMAQQIFRKDLLRAYKGRCAFSGSNLKQALEAAHIVPWERATLAERLDIRNGLLLNVYYHRLFDRAVLNLDENFVLSLGERSNLPSVSEFDVKAIKPLLGKRIRPPHHEKYFPLADYVRRRYET